MNEFLDLAGLELHRPYLILVARLLMPPRLRSTMDPEDLVQQTLLEACSRPRGIQSAAELRTYLRRALRNNLVDALRRGGVAAPQAAHVERSSARLEDWLIADHSSPSERAVREERLVLLSAALARLSEGQRTAVELKHLHGRSVAEIATLMGRTESAVGGLLRHGIQALRGILAEPE
jgi:RNA polymerase sigma-70 factor (ECF subfamily)